MNQDDRRDCWISEAGGDGGWEGGAVLRQDTRCFRVDYHGDRERPCGAPPELVAWLTTAAHPRNTCGLVDLDRGLTWHVDFVRFRLDAYDTPDVVRCLLASLCLSASTAVALANACAQSGIDLVVYLGQLVDVAVLCST